MLRMTNTALKNQHKVIKFIPLSYSHVIAFPSYSSVLQANFIMLNCDHNDKNITIPYNNVNIHFLPKFTNSLYKMCIYAVSIPSEFRISNKMQILNEDFRIQNVLFIHPSD